MPLWRRCGVDRFYWKSKVTMSIASFEVLFSPRVRVLPFQLCLVHSLSLLLDSYPFSPFSLCCWRSSRRQFVSSSPLQDNSAMSRVSHLAHVSVLGRPKLKLSSVLKIFLYIYRDIFGFFGMGAGKRFSCRDLKSREKIHWVSKVDNPGQKIWDIQQSKRCLSSVIPFLKKLFLAHFPPFQFWNTLCGRCHVITTLERGGGARNETWGVEIR